MQIPVKEYQLLEQAIQICVRTGDPDSISQAEKDARICMFLKTGRQEAVLARLDRQLASDLLDLPQFQNMEAEEVMGALLQNSIKHSQRSAV